MRLTISPTTLAWARRKRRSLPRAEISTFFGQATIECGPLAVRFPCDGDLPGVVEFDGDVLKVLNGRHEIRYQDGRLHVDALSVPAVLTYQAPEERLQPCRPSSPHYLGTYTPPKQYGLFRAA